MKCYDFGMLYVHEVRNEMYKESYYHILPVIHDNTGRYALMLPDALHSFILYGIQEACNRQLFELSFKCKLIESPNGHSFMWDDMVIGSYVYKKGQYHLTTMGNENIHVYTGIDPVRKSKAYDIIDMREYEVRYKFLDKKKGGE